MVMLQIGYTTYTVEATQLNRAWEADSTVVRKSAAKSPGASFVIIITESVTRGAMKQARLIRRKPHSFSCFIAKFRKAVGPRLCHTPLKLGR